MVHGILAGLAATGVLAAAVYVVGVKARRRRRGVDADGGAGTGDGGASGEARSRQVLEQSKLVVHALMRSVSNQIEQFVEENARYGNALDRHKTAINKAMTLAGLQEAERLLLGELEEMQSSNRQYRLQLDRANATIKEQQRQLEALQENASVDFLTRIPNRRALDARMDEEVERARRYGNPLSLMVIDIDFFKQVNDRYGHLAGDRVLRAVAHLLNEERRSSDFVARYGGEEFVLLLPETPLDKAGLAAEKIRKKTGQTKFRCDGQAVRITVSAGVAALDKDDSPAAIFQRADAALYRAKNQGRNRVEVDYTAPNTVNG